MGFVSKHLLVGMSNENMAFRVCQLACSPPRLNFDIISGGKENAVKQNALYSAKYGASDGC